MPTKCAALLARPFAAFLRTIARGPTLSRLLDEFEAEVAMDMVLDREVEHL